MGQQDTESDDAFSEIVVIQPDATATAASKECIVCVTTSNAMVYFIYHTEDWKG